eukprot:TRINITY_DN25472_c2_g1_i1.p1 TRINITY_DN25472_c2_g1~~TRINITY_DN25472_c2_g1_i1.p1  ORF type:complete len:805 (+),score=163.11 TRINITY_DN25472_c2_g1_i1:99-2513(+)
MAAGGGMTLDELLDREQQEFAAAGIDPAAPAQAAAAAPRAPRESRRQRAEPEAKRRRVVPAAPAAAAAAAAAPPAELTCPICQEAVNQRSAGVPTCGHIHCYRCIVDWSRRANICTLCKKRFSRLKQLNLLTGKVLRSRHIPRKDFDNYDEAQGVGSEDYESGGSEACENCMVCGAGDREEVLMICDGGGCTRSCHTYCCSPPLDGLPDTELWFCSECVATGNDARTIQAKEREAAEDAACSAAPLPPRDSDPLPPVRRSESEESSESARSGSSSSGGVVRLRRRRGPHRARPAARDRRQRAASAAAAAGDNGAAFLRAAASAAAAASAQDGWRSHRQQRSRQQVLRREAGMHSVLVAADEPQVPREGMGITGSAEGEGAVSGFVRRSGGARRAHPVTRPAPEVEPPPPPPPVPTNPNFVPGLEKYISAKARTTVEAAPQDPFQPPASIEELRDLAERAMLESEELSAHPAAAPAPASAPASAAAAPPLDPPPPAAAPPQGQRPMRRLSLGDWRTAAQRWEQSARKDAAEQPVALDSQRMAEELSRCRASLLSRSRARSCRRSRSASPDSDNADNNWIGKWSNSKQRYYFYDANNSSVVSWKLPKGTAEPRRYVGGPLGTAPEPAAERGEERAPPAASQQLMDHSPSQQPQRRRRRGPGQVYAARAALSAALSAAASAAWEIGLLDPPGAEGSEKHRAAVAGALPGTLVSGVFVTRALRNDVIRAAKAHLQPAFRKGELGREDFKQVVGGATEDFLQAWVNRLRGRLLADPRDYPQLTARDIAVIQSLCDRGSLRTLCGPSGDG